MEKHKVTGGNFIKKRGAVLHYLGTALTWRNSKEQEPSPFFGAYDVRC